jgi:hypothetical protein
LCAGLAAAARIDHYEKHRSPFRALGIPVSLFGRILGALRMLAAILQYGRDVGHMAHLHQPAHGDDIYRDG